jgi:glutamine amidotransferase
MVVILDYGCGNPASIQNMIRKLSHHQVCISNLPKDIEHAQALILPGVGRFDYGMDQLNKLQIKELLNEKVLVQKIPTLGICLGAQLFFDRSEEGSPCAGLSWIPGTVKRFTTELFDDTNLKVPHMGWSDVKAVSNSPLFNNLEQARFYFVHGYHFHSTQSQQVSATCHYGYTFECAVEKENIFGVQFHPEKSHRFGKQLMANFISLI